MARKYIGCEQVKRTSTKNMAPDRLRVRLQPNIGKPYWTVMTRRDYENRAVFR
jgi:hypothetical protein